MPTLRRNPDLIQNKVYSSVKLLSTTNAIDTAVNILHKTVATLSSSNKRNYQNTKSITRSIQNELDTIAGCNSILTAEIAPSLVNTSVSSYCHKRIKYSGPDRLSHVDSSIVITPEKRSVPCKSNSRTTKLQHKKYTTSGYMLIPLLINGRYFTPIEAMKWLELPVRNTKLHGKIMTMIRLKYVSLGKSRLYTM